MIKALSPYYFDTPWISPLTGATATSYTINLYVWSGDKLSIPASPQYSLTKDNIANSVGEDSINISRLVNDFIDFDPTLIEGLVQMNNQRWVHKEIVYTTGNPSDDGVKQLPETELMVKGYTYGSEGRNAQPPTDLIYSSGKEFRASRQTIFSIALGITGTGGVVDIKSYPNNEINKTYTPSVDINSSNKSVQLLNLFLSDTTFDKYVVITYNSVQVLVEIFDEHKYEPVDIYFINKEGEQQSLTFLKERKDSMTVKKQTYESDVGQPKDSFHQYVDLNIQGRTKFTLTSGFVLESSNEAFRQLYLSSKVYEYKNGELLPVNISSKSVAYKTRANDKLINYTVTFENSYNEINNI